MITRASNTTEDAFLGGAITLAQPEKGHRAGLDAVLLAASAPIEAEQTVLDLGTGCGAAGLCVLARVPGSRAILLDRDADILGFAARNIVTNGFDAFATTAHHDIERPGGVEGAGLAQGSVDHVIANPPFYPDGEGSASPDTGRRNAHVHSGSAVEAMSRWCAFAAGAVRTGGTLTMIHHAAPLPSLLGVFERRFGGLQLLPVHPRAAEPAIRIIVRGTKDSRAPLQILPPLVLHPRSGNTFAERAETLLRSPARLF